MATAMLQGQPAPTPRTTKRPSDHRNLPVDLHVQVHSGCSVTFEEFRRSHPAPAIALDGYVDGPPGWDHRGPWGNLDHHAGVERLATPATCQQVALAVRAGLWDWMPGRRATAHLNDCDADASLAVWLLRNPGRVSEPAVDALVRAEGYLDATGGCGHDWVARPMLEAMAWVFEPYTAWRHDRLADTGDAAQLAVIDAVGERIDAHVAGRGATLPSAGSYRRLHATEHVVAVEEQGPYARLLLARDGWPCFVSVRPHGGRSVASVGCTAGGFPVDLHRVWRSLNEAEGLDPDRGDRWGGSDLIGGSPRGLGTALAPADICRVVEEHWARA